MFVVAGFFSTMGTTLSSHAQWTSANEHNKGKLAFTPHNEALLNKIIENVEELVAKYPHEAEVIFKEPFKWHTNLQPDMFSSLNFGSLGYKVRYTKILVTYWFNIVH